MIRAVIFDFYGVITYDDHGRPAINRQLVDYIETSLKPKYQIGLLSNSAGGYVKEQLQRAAIEIFDSLVFSGEEGVSKPHPDIYKIAATRLKLEPRECVFIDDEINRCEGARQAGMQAIVYSGFKQFKTDLEELLVANPDN